MAKGERVIQLIVLLLFGLSLLAACTSQDAEPADPPSPALWEITGPQGTVEGWLFGTVHALPADLEWRSPQVDKAIERADMLVVEVGDLDRRDRMAALFQRLAYDTPTGPVRERIRPGLRDAFDGLVAEADVRRDYFDPMESWAAALALAQVVQRGGSESGADRALLADFSGREIVELEGAQAQLSIFDRLPEAEQRDLLNAVIEEASQDDVGEGTLAQAWRAGNVVELERLTRKGMLADPELRQALLVDRNHAWAQRIENLLSAKPRPLVSVGAGHMLGEDGLPALLEASGYTVRRVD